MGDSDDSYDFASLDAFLVKLRRGVALVMGNRFAGGIAPGAMPALHRYVGNPVLSGIGRMFFGAPVGDFHCGLRGFDRKAALALDLRATGMEFASEMVVKATLKGLPIVEVPTTPSPDGRSRPPHLRSFRDGWRHLRFLLMHAPRWLFLYPGLGLIALGALLMILILPGPLRLGSVVFDVHTLVVAMGALLVGTQTVLFYLLATSIAATERWLGEGPRARPYRRVTSLEQAIGFGLGLALLGMIGLICAVWLWGMSEFSALDYSWIVHS